MDFLKSAVASAISKGPAFPYTFGDRVDIDQSIWTLQNGTRREDGSKCSIFSFDVNANKSRLPLAKNALRKFRTFRHPGIVKVLDTVETDTYIYIATERIEPLGWKTRRKALSEESIKWGLHHVAKTLRFINDEGTSVHGSIRVSSIFTTESGEWKIGGLDVLSSMKEDDAIIYTYGSLVPDSGRYATPEVAKGGWDSIKRNPVSAVDAYNYGILISEVFNGGFSGSDQVGSTKGIPPNMQGSYKRLMHASPKARLSVGHFLEQGQRAGSFFDTPLIQLSEGIENLGLKSETERETFISELEAVAESDDFPEEFFKVKILPELLKSVEFGGGGPKVFALVLRIASKLSEDEYTSQITPVIIRLFGSPDRALRVCLLDNLPLMIDHLPQKVVNDKIFPQIVTGFTDLAPLVREQTVKAVLVIVSKLSDRVINGELLRYLAKTANDDQAGIRTNTTICLGKIARNLGANSRTKVLVAAFSRSLRDPFVHARNAGLMALAATSDLFSEDDCATKLLPAICPSLVDKEKIVRDQANKALDVYLTRIRKYGASLPDSILPPPTQTAAAGEAVPRMSTPQNENSWTGWAISSFTNKLATASGQIEPSNGVAAAAATTSDRSASVPPALSRQNLGAAGLPLRPGVTSPTPSASTIPRVSSNLRTTSAIRSASQEFEAEEMEDFGDDWGAMDDTVDNVADAWAEPEPEPEPASASSRATTVTSPQPTPTSVSKKAAYDDQGEPDFAGWLNAQAAAKKGLGSGSKALPKGLAKKSATSTTTAAAAKTVAARVVKAPVVGRPKAVEKEKKDEEDDWGEAWD